MEASLTDAGLRGRVGLLAAGWVLLAIALGCGQGSAGRQTRAATAASADPPPSLLLISIDTLRADHLGLYGYGRDTSPYLDRLASECLVFDRAYTTAPWTLVAHMSMMTGLEPDDHGVVNAKRGVSPEVPLLAERLRDAGYWTAGFYYGKWLSPRFGFDRGFDVYHEHHKAAEAARHLEPALAGRNPDRPLFLFLHLFDVHSAAFSPEFRGFYDPPEPYDRMFHPSPREVLADVECRPVWMDGEALDEVETEAMVALYDGGVRYVDAWLEERIEGWRASGLLDRALLLITADHGEALGQHGRYGTHGGMYEEGLRIPLLVRFPDGFRAGEREAGLVSVVDYVPTLLEAAGLEVEPWRTGRSLRLPPPADRVLQAKRSEVEALIGAEWKLIESGRKDTAYHLAADAEELDPRSARADGVDAEVGRLRRFHAAAREARPSPPGEPVDLTTLGEEERKALSDLGYAGDVGG
jgi:arylsulfatase A-like enzyme